MYDYKGVKWLREIRFEAGRHTGYRESYGYSADAGPAVPDRRRVVVVHDVATVALTLLVVGHLIVARAPARNRPALRGIILGSVDRAWARRHHARWVGALEDAPPADDQSEAGGRPPAGIRTPPPNGWAPGGGMRAGARSRVQTPPRASVRRRRPGPEQVGVVAERAGRGTGHDGPFGMSFVTTAPAPTSGPAAGPCPSAL